MMLTPWLIGCWLRLRGQIAQPTRDPREQQADAYRDLLIHDPDLQAETIARLFW